MRNLVLIAALALAGCNAQTSNSTGQSTGSVQTAGIGDVVLNATTTRPMPNAFGRADVFGRTVPTGSVTVQFMGGNGTSARFVRSATSIQSTANTMNSTGTYVPNIGTSNFSGWSNGQRVSGTVTNTGGTFIPAAGSQSTSSQLASVNFSANREFVAAGYRVIILNATSSSLTYRVEKM